MFCPMSPLIEDSIVQTDQGHWVLGHTMVCTIVSEVPEDASISWKDDDGRIYCIRNLSQTSGASNSLRECGSSENCRIHHAGTSAAVWRIGGMFIKVKAWRPGMQLESDTIHFVNRVSVSLPTPRVVHSWIDAHWNRSFLVLKAVEGRTLSEAWDTLSLDRRSQLASKIAQFCKTLAALTSERLETSDGNGIVEQFLRVRPPTSEPSWKPQFLGPYSIEQLQSYIPDPSVTKAIKLFHFYHADLGPGNIIVNDDGELAAVLDWESAAFYPMFWIGTKPLVSAGFYLPNGDRKAWAVLLTEALEREGFAPDMELYRGWKRVIDRPS